MGKNISFGVHLRKARGPKFVTQMIVAPRWPEDSSHVGTAKQLVRNLGKSKSLRLAIGLLTACKAPAALIQQAEALK
jgi:hypothetical protein